MTTEPWYVTAFGADYRAVYPHRDLASAREEIAWVLEQGIAGRVLDLCCGFGRHSLALAQAGAQVVGVDLSAELLVQARGLPDGGRLRGRLARADARRLPFGPASFDGLVNLFSSFGYFGERGNGEVLAEVARVLRPGGRALMDLMNPDRIRSTLVPESEREEEGYRLYERRCLADGGRRVQKEVRFVYDDGRERSWTEDVRLFDGLELAEWARPLGLELAGRFGSFAGEPFEAVSPRQILVWSRR